MTFNPNPETAGFCPVRTDRINGWLKRQIETGRLAGASVLVHRRGVTALAAATGLADISLSKPFTTDTIVRLYSMTKAVTTVAAMMCYELGCFQLDDPVSKFLPEFRDTRVWTGGRLGDTESQHSPMTVRQLMTHTSGLTYGFMNANVVDAEYRAAGIEFPGAGGTLTASVERLAGFPLIAQPGKRWNYSVSTDVLGRLIEVWSGRTLQAFFKDFIFGPLDLRDTDFHVVPANAARFAACYAPLSGGSLAGLGSRPDPAEITRRGGLKQQDSSTASLFLEPTSLFSGGGGLTGTLRDYGRFCQMLLNRGELDDVRLLGRKTVEYMRQNQLPEGRDMAAMGQPVWSETSYEGIGFGLGFAVVIDPVKAHIVTSPGEHHWGGAASTFFWIDPAEDLFVVFLTQLMPSSTYPIRRELRTAVYQALID